MNDNDKIMFRVSIAVNMIAMLFLIRLVILYVTHDAYVVNPDAMIPAENWDRAGFLMLLAAFPLLCVNGISIFLAGKVARGQRRVQSLMFLRWLFLLPGIVCTIIAAHYIWFSVFILR